MFLLSILLLISEIFAKQIKVNLVEVSKAEASSLQNNCFVANQENLDSLAQILRSEDIDSAYIKQPGQNELVVLKNTGSISESSTENPIFMFCCDFSNECQDMKICPEPPAGKIISLVKPQTICCFKNLDSAVYQSAYCTFTKYDPTTQKTPEGCPWNVNSLKILGLRTKLYDIFLEKLSSDSKDKDDKRAYDITVKVTVQEDSCSTSFIKLKPPKKTTTKDSPKFSTKDTTTLDCPDVSVLLQYSDRLRDILRCISNKYCVEPCLYIGGYEEDKLYVQIECDLFRITVSKQEIIDGSYSLRNLSLVRVSPSQVKYVVQQGLHLTVIQECDM